LVRRQVDLNRRQSQLANLGQCADGGEESPMGRVDLPLVKIGLPDRQISILLKHVLKAVD
jgi:hypothetical protein